LLSRRKLPDSVVAQVRIRARGLCEYCHAVEQWQYVPFTDEHFAWSSDGLRISGLTAVGRATAEALEMNRDRLVAIRAADVAIGRHPPVDDRRLTRR
jgi:hypothetical protein